MSVIFSILLGIFQFLGMVLFQYWGWVGVVIVLGILIWQNSRKKRWVSDTEYTLLFIEVPRDNDKQALNAEQMFASLHGILRPKQELVREGGIQEHISFEIVSYNKQIRFYVWTPKHLKNFLEGQIYAQYPTVSIQEVKDDYAKQEVSEQITYGVEMTLANNEVVPIKTFKSFEVDPLAGITAVLAKLEDSGEQGWIQVLARPVDDTWHSRGESYIQATREGKSSGGSFSGKLIDIPAYILRNFFMALFKPPQSAESGTAPAKPELNDQQKSHLTATSEKISKLGYEVVVRMMYVGEDRNTARLRVQSLVGAFKQFNDTNNGFKVKEYIQGDDAIARYRARLFGKKGFILNIEELASLYHLPHTNVETPSMVWATSKTAEPPANLPSVAGTPDTELSPVGTTNFRGSNQRFGLKRSDRGRHVYIVGQTGTGKSFLMELLAISDIHYNHGFAVIDPHGDFAQHILSFIPPGRIEDVVYFNPADTNNPMAFNPLEVTDPAMKGHIASEVVGVLEKMFGYSWGPRLEYILRFTLLALLDYPNSTMLGITRMLTDKDYRKKIVKAIQDPVVKHFWVSEFPSWSEKFASEAVQPVLNKVGAFTANPLIRNVVGQPKSAWDIRKLMDEGKILIVNLSRGQVGEDNAATLGALMVSKIQLAAMSRADIPNLEDRRPFYLYVDEFQNFATSSFAIILSEARKYGLNLTVANQFIAQMPQEVRDAVFGNVGSIICFRVGADDSSYLAKYFAPKFEDQDLVGLNNQHFIISMSIDGEKAPPFTAKSLIRPPAQDDHTSQIIELSRQRFSTPREIVEDKIAKWAKFDQPNRPNPPVNGGHQSNHAPKSTPRGPQNKSHHSRQRRTPGATPVKSADNEIRPDQTIKLR
jgi:hypothetical protein